MLNSTDQLLIRACKSKLRGAQLISRLRKIVTKTQKFSGMTDKELDLFLIQWLVDIMPKIDFLKVITESHPENAWKIDPDRYLRPVIFMLASDVAKTHYERVLLSICYQVRHTKTKELWPDYRAPARWRNA